ncbi:hypothetical protein RI129_003094 [Pyrocoelia pectoralis]|uniref:Uncharacterized protein n=1 Tax=Pyrocoelia pectoralis TaxID=417401 RepID=A0AAN7ZMR7_9COLE
MEEFDENAQIAPSPLGQGRKRIRQPDVCMQFRLKYDLQKHTPNVLPKYPTCGHDGRPGLPYFYGTLSMSEVKNFHGYLYQSKDKVHQVGLILACCNGAVPKRGKTMHASVSIKYNVRTEMIRVCSKAFFEITNFSRDRVQRIVRNFVLKGETSKERRGGNRIGPKNDEKQICIKNFIESIKYTESHYCRSKSSVRVYLPCDLNFKKLFDQYVQKFRKYVNANYNIAFGTPQTDCCSTCLRTQEQLKTKTSNEVRQTLTTAHRVHIMKAKAFFKLLKYPKTATFSFDCQKNLALPRLPDQAAYFSQQINYNNLTVVSGSSNTKLTSQNVFSYVWTEIDSPKDSNAIASAESPQHIKKLTVTFPIVGHSFIPPDRVFGLIEKDIKKIPVIVKTDQYDSLIKKHATVRRLGVDWKVYDWRTQATRAIKLSASWHFEFNKAKRFVFYKRETNVLVQGESNYMSDVGMPKSICKKGFSLSTMIPLELPLGTQLKGDKASINGLLNKHYGVNWRSLPELSLYKNHIPPKNSSEATKEQDNVSSEQCQNQYDNFFV